MKKVEIDISQDLLLEVLKSASLTDLLDAIKDQFTRRPWTHPNKVPEMEARKMHPKKRYKHGRRLSKGRKFSPQQISIMKRDIFKELSKDPDGKHKTEVYAELAKQFKCSPSFINNVALGHNWSWVQPASPQAFI